MEHTFEGMFKQYLIDTEEIAATAWDESPEKREAEMYRDAAIKKLLALIPPKKRRRAEYLLEDFDTSYVFETAFYYQYGLKTSVRLLKLLGVL